ncbi:hypothetical protein M409DRAFT_29489 [Zasmidium cellare ATCC 36951]|uniref:Uncharacterized protein n=1 Tax=Zasmidium cellare ATCC 36951 TaxID=1080233 RepID=A0A6A6BZ08_ZASCE|nr:uncharacterized protein M409DRAFT_29489 [Zasmidium cellare ATCC 36951]KAF2160037.1 hypothetical protein M409DRAFT_29489 [Zasmidium cellare ATCC 36951]
MAGNVYTRICNTLCDIDEVAQLRNEIREGMERAGMLDKRLSKNWREETKEEIWPEVEMTRIGRAFKKNAPPDEYEEMQHHLIKLVKRTHLTMARDNAAEPSNSAQGRDAGSQSSRPMQKGSLACQEDEESVEQSRQSDAARNHGDQSGRFKPAKPSQDQDTAALGRPTFGPGDSFNPMVPTWHHDLAQQHRLGSPQTLTGRMNDYDEDQAAMPQPTWNRRADSPQAES